MTQDAIQLDEVTLRYGQVKALDGISLTIPRGEVIGLLGHNGAGKTTTIKLLLGLLSPASGAVRVFDTDPAHSPRAHELRRQIGYLPENLSFYPQLSGRETLRYFARLKGASPQEQNRLLQEVGLSHAADRRVKTYSKGMRQRLGLAQALLNQPKLLILDEPTVGLDPVATRDLYNRIDILKQQGTTVILCSHVLAGIEEHIDRAVILAGGRILALGNLDELRHAAQLPMHIRVRGSLPEEGWMSRIGEQGVSLERINGSQYLFTTPESEKIPLLRTLVKEPGVKDIEISEPSLEAIYTFFSSQWRM